MKAKQNPRGEPGNQRNIICIVTPSAIREGSNGIFCIKKASTWSAEVIDFRKIEQKEVFFPSNKKKR